MITRYQIQQAIDAVSTLKFEDSESGFYAGVLAPVSELLAQLQAGAGTSIAMGVVDCPHCGEADDITIKPWGRGYFCMSCDCEWNIGGVRGTGSLPAVTVEDPPAVTVEDVPIHGESLCSICGEPDSEKWHSCQ